MVGVFRVATPGLLNTNSGARPWYKSRADVDGHRPAIREGGGFGVQHLAIGTRQAQGPIGKKGATYAAFFRGVTNAWGVSPGIAADG